MNDLIKKAALGYLDAGLCALPAIAKQKRPTVSWKTFQGKLPTREECERLFDDSADAACLITGTVSGNLEIIDFDAAGELFSAWSKKIPPTLLAKLVLEDTPSRGDHVVYRCEQPVTGNLKLAQREVPCPGPEQITIAGKTYKPRQKRDGSYAVVLTLVETRGEGGLFLCDPSPGYRVTQGSIAAPPVLTAEEHDILLMAAWELNEYVPEPEPAPRTPAPTPGEGAGRPGDDYNERGDVRAVLEANGWRLARQGENECWRRPGKDFGWSATFKGRVFYVFSSNASPFEQDKAYAPFSVYALLEHNGDFSAAARALREQGFGGASLMVPDIDISGLLRNQVRTVQQTRAPEPAKSEVEMLSWLTGKDLYENEIEKIPYLVERILPASDLCLFAGAGGSLKTWLFLELMRCLSSGQSFLGTYDINTPGPALLMDKESGLTRLALRFKKLGINPELPLLFVPRENLSQIHLGRPGFADWTLTQLDRMKPRPILMGLDSWTRWFRGNENNAGEVADAMEVLMDIATRGSITIAIIDHARKSSPNDRSESRDKVRGSTDKINAVSAAYWIERRDDNLYALEEIKCRDYPPDQGVLGLRFGASLTDPSRLEFEVEQVPEKPAAKIETVKLMIMDLVNKNLEFPLTQAEIIKKLENFAPRSTVRDAIEELKTSEMIKSGEGLSGRGKSPLIIKVDFPED